MEHVSYFQLADVDFIAINFENCEQIEIPADKIRELSVKQAGDGKEVGGIHAILEPECNVHYSCMGHSSEMTSFDRILSRLDIVSIDVHKDAGEAMELRVPYEEDDRGYNAAERCHLGETGELHVEIGK